MPRSNDAGQDAPVDRSVDLTTPLDESIPDQTVDTSGDLDADVPADMASEDMLVDRMIDTIVDADPDTDVMEPPSYCATNSPLVCDGFDTLQDWGATTPRDVQISVDTTRSYRGGSSLKVEINAPDGRGSIFQQLATPLQATTIYMRAYVYLDNIQYSNITWANFRESNPPFHGVSVKIRDMGAALFFAAAPSPNQFNGGRVDKEVWTCWQAEVLLSDTNGGGTLKVDGVDAVSRTNLRTEPATGVSTVSVGADFTSPTEMGTFWIDEFVFDTSPIPCD